MSENSTDSKNFQFSEGSRESSNDELKVLLRDTETKEDEKSSFSNSEEESIIENLSDSSVNKEYAKNSLKLSDAVSESKYLNPLLKDKRHDRSFALHKVVVPDDYDYIPLNKHIPSDPPAKTYPFELDPFQSTAIKCVERMESVLVSAHTSAGKTVIAEYAIAQALKNRQRVIYTSPIKSLSNQKYRELLSEFGDVGLMTGDVSINPSASCLIMTTEILRAMLYKNSEIMHEIAWVIFDEVHYMRDKDRGVVWEETLILLPDAIRFIFLSATLPNALQFARWISEIHKQPCHVVYTDYRPTPLQHFIYPQGADGIYMLVDEKNKFKTENFKKVLEVLDHSTRQENYSKSSKKVKKSSSLERIINMVLSNRYDPIIVFCFSKKECEINAHQFGKLDLNDTENKELVTEIFDSAINQLSEEDRGLRQFEEMRSLLLRGIGIHHSGLLPILKELVEILFQEGLVRILFATETFSIGLNMPARTVLFTKAQKFSGNNFRWLTSGEYMQMSGRAGRRGIDTKGLSIVILDQSIDEQAARCLMNGQADVLNSAFHLSYGMILNLMRIEEISPEDILKKSFYQFQNMESLPLIKEELMQLKNEETSINIPNETAVKEFHDLKLQLEKYGEEIQKVMTHPDNCLPYLQSGRLIQIKLGGIIFPWGVLVNVIKREFDPNTREQVAPHETYVLDVLLPISSNSMSNHKVNPSILVPPRPNETPLYEIVSVLLTAVCNISSIRIYMPRELNSNESKLRAYRRVNEVIEEFKEIPYLDPLEHMHIESSTLSLSLRKLEILEPKLFDSPYYKDSKHRAEYHEFRKKLNLRAQIKDISTKITNTEAIIQLRELKIRQRILRRLGFCTLENVIDIKGRVACEITSGDELLLVELIFQGFFNQMPPEEIAAALSCFVYEDKSEVSTLNLKEPFKKTYLTIMEAAKRIATVSLESKLQFNESDYLHQFKPDIMEPVSLWINGASFQEICIVSKLYEGSIVRTFRRLDELLKQLEHAAIVLGNNELKEKIVLTEQKLHRDIIFSASLYL